MIVQYIIVLLLIAGALTLTLVRLVRFFRAPVSGCRGCSGCAMADLKKGRR